MITRERIAQMRNKLLPVASSVSVREEELIELLAAADTAFIAAAEEREACARLLDRMATIWREDGFGFRSASDALGKAATEIRARGKK